MNGGLRDGVERGQSGARGQRFGAEALLFLTKSAEEVSLDLDC